MKKKKDVLNTQALGIIKKILECSILSEVLKLDKKIIRICLYKELGDVFMFPSLSARKSLLSEFSS